MACFGFWRSSKKRRNEEGKDDAQKDRGSGASQAGGGKQDPNGVHINGANRAPPTDGYAGHHKGAPPPGQHAGARKIPATHLSLIEEESSMAMDTARGSRIVEANHLGKDSAEDDGRAHAAEPIVNSVSVVAQHDTHNQVSSCSQHAS
jgi:hypothetical protein